MRWPSEKVEPRSCLHVVLEEWAHNRYANRDLDVLAGATPTVS